MTTTPSLPDKSRIVAALQARIAEDLDAAVLAHTRAMEGATHEEARPEHDKDTRATEASYLARGLARRVVELREVAAAFTSDALTRRFTDDDTISAGALVAVEDDQGAIDVLLFAPTGGGLQVDVDGTVVRVVTPQAPLGAALLGQSCDDEVALRTPGGEKSVVIVAIR